MDSKQRAKTQLAIALGEAHPLAAPSVTYRAEIAWKDGVPFLVSAPVKLSDSPENSMQLLLKKCLDLPYDGKDPALLGLTNGEALIINLARDAARGDHDARTTVLDRLLGRPQQNIKSVSLTGDLNEFLDKVAQETQTHTVDVIIRGADPDSAEDL
jgi:hypothetical protein